MMDREPTPTRVFGEFEDFEADPTLVTPADLNNLHMWLPNSGHYRFYEEGDGLGMMKEGKLQGKTVGDFFQDVRQTLDSLPEEEKDPILRLDAERGQTPRSDIDARIDVTARLNDVLIPLYRALRAKGYSHRDLVT